MRKRKLYVSELVKRYKGILLIAILTKECGYVYEKTDKQLQQWFDYQVKHYDTTSEYLRIFI